MSTTKPKVIGVIPARYNSSRLPGKMLVSIAGKPLIQWVYEHARQARLLDELLVAVDDRRVFDCVLGFGGKAVMTSAEHKSGTDRIAEVMEDIAADIVVNIQGDMPFIATQMIDETVKPLLDFPEIHMSTLKMLIPPEAYSDPSVVKVVTDEKGFALYFSRSLLPFPRISEGLKVYEHIGLYVYRKDFLFEFARMPQTYLERIESLEQLRVMEKGYKILVVETKCPDANLRGFMVDTPADLIKAEELARRFMTDTSLK